MVNKVSTWFLFIVYFRGHGEEVIRSESAMTKHEWNEMKKNKTFIPDVRSTIDTGHVTSRWTVIFIAWDIERARIHPDSMCCQLAEKIFLINYCIPILGCRASGTSCD
jgi:hypothetical protein